MWPRLLTLSIGGLNLYNFYSDLSIWAKWALCRFFCFGLWHFSFLYCFGCCLNCDCNFYFDNRESIINEGPLASTCVCMSYLGIMALYYFYFSSFHFTSCVTLWCGSDIRCNSHSGRSFPWKMWWEGDYIWDTWAHSNCTKFASGISPSLGIVTWLAVSAYQDY